jgi:threonine/homoserine/homoserine lactone efflux protein
VTAFGIILSVVSVVGIAIVAWMLWWAAREDGRDQKRREARLRRRS